ncbi:UDP-glucose 4-epimerase GalE [Pilimelia columellifera]|uniref:UDP-glucose 4-epimerase n=1 Tax=Pilimelia columellifera subsp. columellifera TaxID=706583 RepID=A0ABN3NJS4_9ACTN
MKLLVTGGAGYIGSVVSHLLLDAGHEVVVLDDLRTGHADAVPAGARLAQVPLAEVASVLTPDAGFDGVLHLAGLIAAGESMVRPELYWDANVVGSLALLDAVRAARTPRLVFSSTAAVYGNPSELPLTEAAITAPTNTYGATKLAIDHAITSEVAAYGLAAVSLRYFNVVGALRRPDGTFVGERHDPETHLIPIALQVAAGERETLDIFGDDYPTTDGTCVRDYIHVEDLARAHLLALAAATPKEHRVYNLGNGNGFSNLEVVAAVRQVTGRPVPVRMAPRREGDPAELVASSARARQELGWAQAKPTITEMIDDAWAFLQR